MNPLDDMTLPCRNLAFYLLAAVADPQAAVQRHRSFLEAHAMVGRVYIHATGVNAQARSGGACAAAFASPQRGAPLLLR